MGVITSSGNVSVTLTVPGTAPTTPAIILNPISGTVNQQNIIVSGTCGAGLVVKIFNNSMFIGSQFCSVGGTFSINIILNNGINNLTALNFDALNQPGPISPTVSVTLIGPISPVPNMIIQTDSQSKQINPNVPTTWNFSIKNGTAPYTATIDWGDNSSDTKSIPVSGNFDFTHSYKNPGNYTITLNVVDALGNKASLQVVVLVNGVPIIPPIIGPTTPVSKCDAISNNLSTLGLIRCRVEASIQQFWIVVYWLFLFIVGLFWFIAFRRRRKEEDAEKTPKRRRPAHA